VLQQHLNPPGNGSLLLCEQLQKFCRISRIKLAIRALWRIDTCVLRFAGYQQDVPEGERGQLLACWQPKSDKRISGQMKRVIAAQVVV